MELQLHPAASARFNERGLSLVRTVSSQPMSPLRSHRKFVSDEPPPIQIRIDESRDSTKRLYDGYGKQIGMYRLLHGTETGLEGDAYTEMSNLAEAMQRTESLEPFLSVKTINDAIFEWLLARFDGSEEADLCDFVLGKCSQQIKTYEVWVPVSSIILEAEMLLGRVVLRPISTAQIDGWHERALQERPKDSKVLAMRFAQMKEKLQGRVAGVVTSVADKMRAKQRAMLETKRSLAMLRIMSPASFIPHATCYCTLKGMEHFEEVSSLTAVDGALRIVDEERLDKNNPRWHIAKADADKLAGSGLADLSELAGKERQSPFYKSLFAALSLYSKVSLVRDFSDKLVYIFASLESLFLKNESEPIQQNLGERIATLVGNGLKEKKAIIQSVKKVYKARSAFVHHAQQLEDTEALREFMIYAWTAMLAAVKKRDLFNKKEDFLEAIDDRKLA